MPRWWALWEKAVPSTSRRRRAPGPWEGSSLSRKLQSGLHPRSGRARQRGDVTSSAMCRPLAT
ncbi:MAG TPA: hypothetical protein VK458_02590, partial [Myxococcaceae bacterium]|nr:hypothetical protein [Myxococcaceae bacterium]